MARFLALVSAASRLTNGAATAAGMTLFLSATLVPAAPATNIAPAVPAPPSPMTSASPAGVATALAGKPAVPPVPQDYFQRYGKILAPGTEPEHPLKLAMPMPEVGQIRIPSPAEIDMRVKLEQLATLSDEEIRLDLYHWPAFNKMNLADEGAMLMRIQQFRDRRSHIAQDKAHALGLVTLKPDQMARFEKEYWDKRLQLDRDLAKQFEPILKAREARINEELFREFSVPAKPTAPAPPTAALAQDNKLAAPSPALGSSDPKPSVAPGTMPPVTSSR